MEDNQDLEIIRFQDLPFDNFIIEHWDPNSPLSKEDQKRSLVERWIKLGERGRRQYFQPLVYEHEIPDHVPRDLLTPKERAFDGQYSKILWVRTWLGEQDDLQSRLAADIDYRKLCFFALKSCNKKLEGAEFLNEHFLFETPDIAPSDLLDGDVLATPWSTPSWLVSALTHCPDQLSGVSIYGDDTEYDKVDGDQMLLVCIADRKACKDGYVLLVGVNHKGQILPYRVRERAAFMFLLINDWDEDGIELREIFAQSKHADEDEELYLEMNDGWSFSSTCPQRWQSRLKSATRRHNRLSGTENHSQRTPTQT